MNREAQPVENPNWNAILERVNQSNDSGLEELYQALQGFRAYLCRHIGRDNGEDAYHDLILDLVKQIRRGCVREPERFPGYVRVIVQRKLMEQFRSVIRARNTEKPVDSMVIADRSADIEGGMIRRQQIQVASKVLTELTARDRDILTRFYLKGERPEAIQAAFHMTPTQFRLIKSRAKARFTHLCQARLEATPVAVPSV